MKTYVNTITIKISDIQYNTLNKLRNRNIKVSNFILLERETHSSRSVGGR